MNNKQHLMKAGLVLTSVLLSFLILELVLRLFYPAQLNYFVWQPRLQHQFYPDTSIIGGVDPVTHFTINKFGLRTNQNDLLHGPDLWKPLTPQQRRAGAKYYLCIGASTTEGLYLDDSKTWPEQFAAAARQNHDTTFAFIGNMGKSGCTMRQNYIHLKYAVPQYKRINTVFVMSGLNDMMRRLSEDTAYKSGFEFTPEMEDSFVHTIFLRQGRGQGKTWLRRTALFYVFQNAYHKQEPLSVDWQVEDSSAGIYKTWRSHRQSATRFLDTLPDMRGALDEYGRLVNAMIDEAQKQKLEIIFLNETAIWKDSMPANELSRIWQGGIGKFQKESGHVYYTPKALRHGLDLYNQKLAQVCAARHIPVIDIDAQLPHNLTVFYDDCHFNVHGAHLLGNLVYNAISQHRY